MGVVACRPMRVWWVVAVLAVSGCARKHASAAQPEWKQRPLVEAGLSFQMPFEPVRTNETIRNIKQTTVYHSEYAGAHYWVWVYDVSNIQTRIDDDGLLTAMIQAVLKSDHGFEKHPFTLGSHFGGELSGAIQARQYKEAPEGGWLVCRMFVDPKAKRGVMWMGVAPPDRAADARTFVESAQDEVP